MKKWAVAVILGVLAPYPVNLLAQYLAQTQAGTGNVWYGYALSALIFFSYFFLGVYLGKLAGLRTTGAARRVRWGELALGALLFLLSLAMKLEQAAGLVTANIKFLQNNAALAAAVKSILQFSDGLYLWTVLSGFFLADAFEGVPAQSAGAAEAPRVKKVREKKVKKKKGAATAEAQPNDIQSMQAVVQNQPAATQAAPAQPGAIQSAQAASMEAQFGAIQSAQAASMEASFGAIQSAQAALIDAQLGAIQSVQAPAIQPVVNQPAQAGPVVQTQLGAGTAQGQSGA